MTTSTVKLFRLTAPDTPPTDLSTDFPWDDAETGWCNGMIVTAASSSEARQVAAENSEDEGREVWLNQDHTVCLKLGDADAGIAAGLVMLKSTL